VANKTLKLTGAPISVSREINALHPAPADYPHPQALEAIP
jgi:hypothetical protein